MSSSKAPEIDIPTARVISGTRWSWIWLVPLAAAVLAAWLGYHAWLDRGIAITIRFDRGHGLRAGDPVRFRGTTVGVVDTIRISPDLADVLAKVRLDPDAAGLAREGSRFWIERPRFGVDGIGGLETLVGPSYIAVSPGDGMARQLFIGLDDPPVVETQNPGDLHVTLEMQRRHGLSAGAPVSYRGVRVGTVLRVALSTDGGSVEAVALVERPYARLVRERTRFFVASGIAFTAGWRGISVEVDSLQTALVGGIALATPPDAGEAVSNGHRFPVVLEPDPDWLEWNPQVPIGSALTPLGLPLPVPAQAAIGWEQGWFGTARSNRGWVLDTELGLLGPTNVLHPGGSAHERTIVLQVDGRSVSPGEPRSSRDGISLLPSDRADRWPASRLRIATAVEDCLIIANPGGPPYPLSASRLTLDDRSWRLDPELRFDPSLHGAIVVAQRDGAVVGVLLATEDGWRVARLEGVLGDPASLPDAEP